MPNCCNFLMKITGKEEAVKEVVQVIKADYDYSTNEFSFDRHLWRVFEADVTEEDYNETHDYYAIVSGNCAWSVSSCMLDRPHSYQNRYKNDEDNRGTDIVTESRNLGVIVEIYSSEPGVGLQEHYYINKGNIEINQCVEYEEHFWDQDEYTMEDYNEEYGTNFTEDQFDEDGCCKIGGFENWDFA